MALDMLGEFAGQPVWLWIAFLAFVGFVLWVDLALINNKDGRISAKKSGLMWASFAACALVFGFAPDLFALRLPSLPWLAAALGLAAGLPALEAGLGGLLALARSGRWPGRLELAAEWRRADPAPAYAMALIVAVGEELLLRLALFGLLARLGLPPAAAVAASAVAYGLNHARSGFPTVLAKTLSRLAYALVFLLSGGSVLASAACHAGQNVLVLAALSGRKASHA